MTSRRTILKGGLTTLGGLCVATALPRALLAQQDGAGKTGGNTWQSGAGNDIVIHPINHASFVIEAPGQVVYVDPVGAPDLYADLPPPNVIFVTHEHGDHFEPETLAALVADGTRLFSNPAVYGLMPADLRDLTIALGNGDESNLEDTLRINAVPAYNVTADRLKFHPEGRDNGYVLTLDGTRLYVAGDTEATPEMRALSDIDIAFVPMNLPYTMGIEQAASGVLEFAPRVVYPYHYRGEDGLSDIEGFASMVADENEGIEVALRDWYA